jgi:putative membrane-bound dehydrogenase-like protein
MKRLPFLLLPILFVLASTADAQVAPEKAEATFKVVDGLEYKLWASEPLFVNPTCMDIDHKGRVWVCESVNYRTSLHGKPLNRKEGDRIVILEDTKGEGKADKATTFYQAPEMLAPLGIAVAKDPEGPGYKVFVCQSPDILVFTDTKGEGKADGPPKKLLSGFRGIDHDHGVHGISIGPDMKLYFSVGDEGVKDLQSSDGKGRKWTSNNTDCRAGTIWRCDMDGKNLELIAHNFRNEYEPCVDSFGTVFTSDNDDDGSEQTRICYVMPGGNYGYHPRGPGQSHWHEEQPGVVPKILRTYFGSPTGICVYEGTLLPKKYWGQLLHVDAGPRHVRCYHLEADGAGYKVDREDMVTSTDTWFRPSDICVAPDGSVFVADWYDPGVGGHGMGDTTRGRIYRLAPNGTKYSVPKVDLETKQGRLEALASPACTVRYMVMAKLRTMKPGEVAAELYGVAGDKGERAWLRARATWQIDIAMKRNKDRSSIDMPFALAEDANPQLKCTALRIWMDVDGRSLAAQEDRPLKKALMDSSATVRREVLLTMRDVDPTQVKPLIVELAKKYDGQDRFYLAAVGIAVGQDPKRREIILADFEKEFPEWNERVAGLVWELRPPSMMPVMEKHLKEGKLPVAQQKQIVDILGGMDDPAAGKHLLAALKADAPAEVRDLAVEKLRAALPGKWKDLRSSKELGGAIDLLLRGDSTTIAGLSLIAARGRVEDVEKVWAIAYSVPAEDVRTAAIQTLGNLPSSEAVAKLRLLVKIPPESLQVEAVRALGEISRADEKAPGSAEAFETLKMLVSGKDGPLLRTALPALAASRRGSLWLLELNDSKQLGDNLKPDIGSLLRNTVYNDVREKALKAFPRQAKLDPKKLPSAFALAGRRGNAKHGEEIMAASAKSDLQCLKCHTVRGVGGQIGPDLSMIGKKASRENLFESILLPSKAIADQYVVWDIDTKKGVRISGLLVEETPEFLTLRDANGKDTRVAVKDIDERKKSLISIMPADLLAYMSEDEMVDLVEYLFTLKTPVLAFDYWRIAGPFDNGDNDAGLDKVFPPEKSIDLAATYNGKVGKVTWRTVKPAPNGYFDLMAFHGKNSPNSVSYLYREIESPVEQEGNVSLGTDDGSKLWVDGELVYTTRAHNAAIPDAAAVKVKLKKGKNTLLLKINNGNDPHGFYLAIHSEQELKRVETK